VAPGEPRFAAATWPCTYFCRDSMPHRGYKQVAIIGHCISETTHDGAVVAMFKWSSVEIVYSPKTISFLMTLSGEF